MTKLIELSNTTHKHLKVKPSSIIEFASSQQIMRLRITEVTQAAACLPVVFTRNGKDGSWVLSALTSLSEGRNSFVRDGKWQAIFTPSTMKTHPLYLMKSPKDEDTYTIGIDESSSAFSSSSGEALFGDNGAPSLHLSRVKSLLEADIKNGIETHRFAQQVEQLQLLKAVDLNIQFQEGSSQKLAGLYVLDESKLQHLSGDILAELSQLGYLIPMHCMLASLYQLNMLIRKHNEVNPKNIVSKLKLEVAKDLA